MTGEDTKGIVISALEKAWFKNEGTLFKINPPELLFHYTSASGLSEVLKNNGMYAAPSFAMNDPSELIYGLSITEEACQELLNSPGVTAYESAIANALLGDPCVVKKQYSSFFKVLVLISLSEDPDNLSQWRCYGDDGHGFAIGLSTQEIDFNRPAQSLVGAIGSWGFYKCEYVPANQKKLVRHFIQIFAQVCTQSGLKLNSAVLAKYALLYLWMLVSTFKHPAYADEREWRVQTAIDPNDPGAIQQFSTYVSGRALRASCPFDKHNDGAAK
jgi:hypothetical protein